MKKHVGVQLKIIISCIFQLYIVCSFFFMLLLLGKIGFSIMLSFKYFQNVIHILILYVKKANLEPHICFMKEFIVVFTHNLDVTFSFYY